MEQLLEKIDRLKAEYDALLPLAPERQRALEKKFRLEFNFNSNHIEGNTLTYGETELLLYFDDTKGHHTMREYEEMKAHDVAYQLIRQWANDPRPISEVEIKNLNETLLVRPFWKDAITPDGQPTRRQILVGEYKQQPNSVRLANGEIFEYTSPLETPAKMQELVEWYRQRENSNEFHPLLVAALFHYRFVCIHPFDDGNGRVSRLLMNYVLLKQGYPPVVIKSADKNNYLRALNAADTGDTDSFVRYVGEQLIWSLELSIKAAKGESIEEPDDLDKEIALLQRELTSKTEVSKKGTPENVVKVFEEGLIDVFQTIETKISSLSSSFLETGRRFFPNMYDASTSLVIHQKASDWDELRKWLSTEVLHLKHRMALFQYIYELRGLKSTVRADIFEVTLRVEFQEFNYKIGETLYPYGKPLTEAQKQEIIRPIVKDIIERIKNASDRG
jgi:Fic family protein